MSVDAKLVKTLRERTGAGMMDCKKALVEANGDLDSALDHLRKAGIAKATKRVLFEIFVPEVSAFPRAFAIEEKSAPAPAVAVINPNPDGP